MSNKIIENLLYVNGKTEDLRVNASTLPEDAWKLMDKAFLEGIEERLVFVKDLKAKGLIENLGQMGFSKTLYSWQQKIGVGNTTISIDGNVKADATNVEFVSGSIPLPLISSFVKLGARALAASVADGHPLDVTLIREAGKEIASQIEDMAVKGTDFTFGGASIYGLETAPNRATGTIVVSWATATSAQILADVFAMTDALTADKFHGEKNLYLPSEYEAMLGRDYGSAYPGTILERILKVPGIASVKILDKLTAGNVALVNMQSETVRMIEGSAPTLIQADSANKMSTEYYGYSIEVLNIRDNSEGNCGIANWSE